MTKLDLDVYDDVDRWWRFDVDATFRPLHETVRARAAYFDRHGLSFSGARVLDVGSGGGYVAEEAARRGGVVLALDRAPRALVAARGHATGLPIAHAVADAAALPVGDASFDRAILADVLVLVDDPAAVLAEVARALAPGGVLYLSTVSDTALARLVLVVLGERVLRVLRPGTHDPARFHRPAALRAMLDACGLDLVHVEGMGPAGFSASAGLTMGRWPTTAVMYQGHAVRRASDARPPRASALR